MPTPNLLLNQPTTVDPALIGDLNDNMDILDALWTATMPTDLDMEAAGAVGNQTDVARADHEHAGPGFAAPVSTTDGANAEGAATTLARSNHVHHAPPSWINHIEELILEAATADDVMVYVPSAFADATLTLRGRAPRAGLLAAHDHGAGGSTSADAAGTTDNQSGDHTHSATSGNASADHTHSVSVSDSTVDHTHSFTTGNQSASHTHSGTSSSNGSHEHTIATTGTPSNGLAYGAGGGSQSDVMDPGGSHDHTLTTGAQSASHTHSGTTGSHNTNHGHAASSGGHSATHTHSVTTGGVSATHNHTITATHSHDITVTEQGTGGQLTPTRPSGVTVTINGVDRTAALGGGAGFGSSGSDWNNADLDVAAYLTAEAWNTILVESTTVGRLKVHVMAKLS